MDVFGKKRIARLNGLIDALSNASAEKTTIIIGLHEKNIELERNQVGLGALNDRLNERIDSLTAVANKKPAKRYEFQVSVKGSVDVTVIAENYTFRDIDLSFREDGREVAVFANNMVVSVLTIKEVKEK